MNHYIYSLHKWYRNNGQRILYKQVFPLSISNWLNLCNSSDYCFGFWNMLKFQIEKPIRTMQNKAQQENKTWTKKNLSHLCDSIKWVNKRNTHVIEVPEEHNRKCVSKKTIWRNYGHKFLNLMKTINPPIKDWNPPAAPGGSIACFIPRHLKIFSNKLKCSSCLFMYSLIILNNLCGFTQYSDPTCFNFTKAYS